MHSIDTTQAHHVLTVGNIFPKTVKLQLVPINGASTLSLAQRWFRSKAAMFYDNPHAYYFSVKALARMWQYPEDFMMLLEDGIRHPHFARYLRPDGSQMAVTKYVDDKATYIFAPGDVPYLKIKETIKIPFYYIGLSGYLAAMQRYEDAQKIMHDTLSQRPDLCVRGGFGDENPQQKLLQLIDQGPSGGIYLDSLKAFYPSYPYDLFRVFAYLLQKGLIRSEMRGIDLGSGLGLVPLIGSIFLSAFDGVELRPELVQIANQVLAQPLSGTGARTFRQGDFRDEDLGQYDVIFIYSFLKDEIFELREKIKALKSGTILIENQVSDEKGFLFNVEGVELIDSHHGFDKIFIFRK